MAVEKAGVVLVAEGYDDYMNKLRQVNAQQAQTFGGTGTQGMAAATRQTQAMTGAFSGLGNVLGTVKGAMGALAAAAAAFMAIDMVRGLKQFAEASVQVAMRNETLGVSLGVVGKQAGYSAEQVAYAEAMVKKQGITTQAARQALLRMAQANIEFADASKLARIAQDAAVIGNINSSEAFERMIYGIQSGQTEVLKTIGINVQFEASYRKMMLQHNKTRLELTETEKAQARANAVMEAGQRIAGTYEAAMNTAGKQQQSLARYIEETQYNLGQLLLPFEEVRVKMETAQWKGLQEATRALPAFGEGIREIIRILTEEDKKQKESTDTIGQFVLGMFNGVLAGGKLTQAMKVLGITTYESLAPGETLAMRFGRGLLDIGRAAAQASVMIASGMMVAFRVVDNLITGMGQAITAITKGDFAGAGKALGDALAKPFKDGRTLADEFRETFDVTYQELKRRVPDLFKDYSELGTVAETSLERQKTAADIAIEGLDKQRASLEGVLNTMKQVEKVQRDYAKGVAKAGTQRDKAIASLEKQTLKDREKAAQKYNEAMIKLDQDYARQMADLQARQTIDITRARADLYRTLKRMEEAYQLERSQSTRRFQVQERRLIADGDILALMNLREDFALEQQESKENYDKQRKDAKEDGEEKLQQQREDLQRQIDELGANIQERRAQLTETYQQELDQITTNNTERRAEIQASYLEQLEDLRTSRDEQLALLGESLKEQGVVTEEGMQRLAAILNTLFGPDGASDALMKGWTERSTSAIQTWADTLSAEIARIEARIEAIRSTGTVPTGTTNNRGYGLAPHPQNIPMRTGGIGVVTGPKIFEVEPGRKEFFMFAPMRGGRSASQTINAIVSGGIDIRGAEGASQSVVNAAVTTTLGELREAIKRISRS